jgi:transcriptional regulator with XRE-family HTH domain
MAPLNTRYVNQCNPYHTWREKGRQSPDHAAMAGVPDSQAQKDMGARLRAVREALDLNQDELCESMGVVVTTLSGWETGRNQIDIVKLAKAATRWGFTTDWVARGDLASLRRDLGDKVEAIIAKGNPQRRGRPQSRIQSSDPPATPTPPKDAPPSRPRVGGSVAENEDIGDCVRIVPA